MSKAHYETFARNEHFKFFCAICIKDAAGVYNFSACLLRIFSGSQNIVEMRKCAESEHNLLKFYDITLPPVVQVKASDVRPHNASMQLLRNHSPWLTSRYVPGHVEGDGNCLFRAVSLGMYGHERAHIQLRLLCAIEVLLHSDMYDVDSPYYYAPFQNDDRLVLLRYTDFVTKFTSKYDIF